MDFTIKNVQEGVAGVSRTIGYVIIDTTERNEYNMVRKFGRDSYPRFHVYLKQLGNDFVFSLHLDQKKPVYENSGSHAHNGEYFGPIVDDEADRIKRALSAKDNEKQEEHGSGWDN